MGCTPTPKPTLAIADLSWFVLGICATICIVIAGLLTYSLIRPGRNDRVA
jgi:hypothetical protein